MKLDKARSQGPLLVWNFGAHQETKMATLASDWLRHFNLILL